MTATFTRSPLSRIAAVSVLGALACLAILVSSADAAPSDEPNPFFGIISQRSMEVQDFDHMKSGRVGSYRQPIDWSSVQNSGDAQFRWERIDRVVETTAERGITFLPTLYNTPHWLAGDRRRMPIWGSYPIEKWKRFLISAVARYGSDGSFWVEHPDVPYMPVRKWQIWNEPNIRNFAWPVSPGRYAKLLRVSAGTIRRIDPHAKIVTAGFYAKPPTGTGIEASRFLRRLYRIRGFRNSFDIAAVHPYARTTRQSLERTFPLRKALNQNHDRRKRMLITELGWGSDSATVFGMGSIDDQAIQLRSAYRALLKHRRQLKLDGVYWFSWSDLKDGTLTCSFCLKTGLFDSDGAPKPAWYSLLDFSRDS